MESVKSFTEKILYGKVKVDQSLIDEASRSGIVLFYFNGEQISSKKDFFNTAKGVMDLPDYFGDNWDAFEECINDLSWVPSRKYIFVYHNASRFFSKSREDGEILTDILEAARQNWRDEGITFESVFIDA